MNATARATVPEGPIGRVRLPAPAASSIRKVFAVYQYAVGAKVQDSGFPNERKAVARQVADKIIAKLEQEPALTASVA